MYLCDQGICIRSDDREWGIGARKSIFCRVLTSKSVNIRSPIASFSESQRVSW